MSRCEACASEKTCHPKDSSRFYRKDDKTPVIALLGQPNSGKSTIFNNDDRFAPARGKLARKDGRPQGRGMPVEWSANDPGRPAGQLFALCRFG